VTKRVVLGLVLVFLAFVSGSPSAIVARAMAQIPVEEFPITVPIVEGTTCPASTIDPFWGVCYPGEDSIKQIPLPCWCGLGGPLNPFKGSVTLPPEAYPLP